MGKQWTNVLKQGGSMNGFDLYKMSGIDMATIANYKQTVAHVGEIVDELEQNFKNQSKQER